MVQVILLKNDIVLISKVEEVGGEIGEPDCLLIEPYMILGKHETDLPPEDRFVKWMADYTDNRKIMIRSDDVLTFVEPNSKLVEFYKKLTK